MLDIFADLSIKKAIKQEVKTEPKEETDEAPPLPPKPSHLARTKATPPPNVEKSPSVNVPQDTEATEVNKSPEVGNTTHRSRTSSEARLESDSSLSDGDDMMLQVGCYFIDPVLYWRNRSLVAKCLPREAVQLSTCMI